MNPTQIPLSEGCRSDIQARLEAIVRPHLRLLKPGESLARDQSLGEAGLDSMASIDLLLELEEHFGVPIPDEALHEDTFSTLATLEHLLESVSVR